MSSPVLLSWVARNNDPYERDRRSREFKLGPDGEPVHGPTLTLLFDDDSPYRNQIEDVVLLAQLDPTSKAYTPLGSPERRTSDFRLITATNVSLPELRHRLDPDFLDRISPLQLRMPPLRELRDDLDWIWEGVYAEAAARAGVEPTAIPAGGHAEIVAHLRQHPLPGNVRDLYRVAYRLLAHAEDAAEQLDALVTSARNRRTVYPARVGRRLACHGYPPCLRQ